MIQVEVAATGGPVRGGPFRPEKRKESSVDVDDDDGDEALVSLSHPQAANRRAAFNGVLGLVMKLLPEEEAAFGVAPATEATAASRSGLKLGIVRLGRAGGKVSDCKAHLLLLLLIVE